MTIVSITPTFNEVDILPWAVRKMQEQGVDVYVIDGWSTDGTWELLPSLGLIGYERFPVGGDTGIQECREILHQVEWLSRYLGADWYYYSDADEIRRPQSGQTLAEAIARLDAAGFNAINHAVRVYFPTDDNWTPDKDPEAHFRYYDDEKDLLCAPWIPQLKCWKNLGVPVVLAGGGHEVTFPGRRTAVEPFLLKHYPWRTQAQAERRLRTRLARRCQSEYRDGWGVHYDAFRDGLVGFLRDPQSLKCDGGERG